MSLFEAITEISQSGVQAESRGLCLCFFIDGLDEYQGNHHNIIQAVSNLAKLPNVKICLSSRPWNVFQFAFGSLADTNVCLVMQELTREDIALYVQQHLEEDQRFIEAQRRDGRCSEIVDEITKRADGVFLWVFLLVNELIKSLTNAGDFLTLQRRLHRIPPGLDQYFRHMFDNLEEFYRQETARVFRVVLEMPFDVPIEAFLVFCDTDEVAKLMVNDHTGQVNDAELEMLCSRTVKRIEGRCRDLLEVKSEAVQFLHRTVRDFLATDEMMEMLNTRAGLDFDLDRNMCRMAILGLQFQMTRRWEHLEPEDYTPHRSDLEHERRLICAFFHHARRIEIKEQEVPADLHEAFEAIKPHEHQHSHTHFPMNLFQREHLLALMSLPLALKASVDSSGLERPKEEWIVLLRTAIHYVTELNYRDKRAAVDERLMVKASYEFDPERRCFQHEMVSLLLNYGADPDDYLFRFANFPPREYATLSLFNILAELIRCGGKVRPYTVEFTQSSSDVFGASNAQWLLRLQGNDASLTESFRAWIPWLRR